MSIYSVGRDREYQMRQIDRTKCFTSISWEGLTCETLTKANCHHLSWLFAFQSCVEHMLLFARRLLASYPRKLLWSSIALSLHTLSHTTLVRTYVFLILRTYVMILCNWFILWQNALYLYLGRLRMCLNTLRNHVSRSRVKAFKSVQEIKQRVQIH